MVNIIPVMQFTLDAKGTKRHDVDALVKWLKDRDNLVFIINAGVIPYRDINTMGITICHRCRVHHIKVRYCSIKGDNDWIVLFKD